MNRICLDPELNKPAKDFRDNWRNWITHWVLEVIKTLWLGKKISILFGDVQ